MKNKSGVKCDCFARKNKDNLMQQSLLLVFRHCLSLSALSYVCKIHNISLSPQFLQDSSLCINLSCAKWNYISSNFFLVYYRLRLLILFSTSKHNPLSKSCSQSILLVRLLCRKSFLKYTCRWIMYFLSII